MQVNQPRSYRTRVIVLWAFNLMMYTSSGFVSRFLPSSIVTDIIAIALALFGVVGGIALLLTIIERNRQHGRPRPEPWEPSEHQEHQRGM